MSRKKTMKLWQMILILILSAGLLATMFLPAYHVTSEALDKGMESAQSDEDDKDDKDKDKEEDKEKDKKEKKEKKDDKGDEEKSEDDNSAYTDAFEENLKTKDDDEDGLNIESISVLTLMTKSFSDICYNGQKDEDQAKKDMGEDNYDALNGKHKMTKILLWVVYGVLLVVILTTILGFCLKWTKYIPLAISTVYGVFVSIVFAVLQFATISGVAKETGELTEKFIGMKFADVNVEADKIAPGFLSFAFLLGLIVAVAFLIVSVLSMFVGNQAEADDGYMADQEDDWDRDWNQPQPQAPVASGFTPQAPGGAGYPDDIPGTMPFDPGNNMGTAPAQPDPLPKTVPSASVIAEPVREEPKKPVQPAKPAVRTGKVRCTKGTTSGPSGYALTPDRKVVVGKSPHQANLVIVNNTHISNVHCTVRYEPSTDSYIVRDHSSNGTFVNGAKLQKEVAMTYPAGTVLRLADGSVEITLG